MRICNHIYKYIATEQVLTDQWHYGERVYKKEIIVYCPLCLRHFRLSEKEWEEYKKNNNKYLEKLEKRETLTKFNKNKIMSFTCENALFNLESIIEACITDPVIGTKKNIEN